MINIRSLGISFIFFFPTLRATSAVHLVLLLLSKCWSVAKLIRGRDGSKESGRWSSREHLRRRVGVEENIVLPSTGKSLSKA